MTARGAIAGFVGHVRSTNLLISAASPSRSVFRLHIGDLLVGKAFVMSAFAAVERSVTRAPLLLLGVASAILPRASCREAS